MLQTIKELDFSQTSEPVDHLCLYYKEKTDLISFCGRRMRNPGLNPPGDPKNKGRKVCKECLYKSGLGK